jgi:hypothetical protein
VDDVDGDAGVWLSRGAQGALEDTQQGTGNAAHAESMKELVKEGAEGWKVQERREVVDELRDALCGFPAIETLPAATAKTRGLYQELPKTLPGIRHVLDARAVGKRKLGAAKVPVG